MKSLVAATFLLLTIGWPLLVPGLAIKLILIVTMVVVLRFTAHFTGSQLVSFWRGLTTVCDLLRASRPRLWWLWVLPVLTGSYVAATAFTLVGLVRGRDTSQLLWVALVGRFAQTHARSRRRK